MKRKMAIILAGVLVLSPYSLNFGALKSISLVEADSIETVKAEEVEVNQTANAYYEYVPEEINLIEKLDEQVSQIEQDLETLQEQKLDPELEKVVEEIQSTDINQVVAEEIKDESDKLNLDNTEVIVETLENDNISIEEAKDKLLEQNINQSVTEQNTEVVEDNAISATLEGETPEENTGGENVEDPIATAVENEDSGEASPENVLLDSNFSVNIVKTDGEDTTVKELGEFVKEVVENNKNEQYSLINKNTASASDSGWGWFFASQNTAVGNMNTTNAKFINFGTITSSGGILKPKSFSISLTNKRKTTDDGSYSTHATKSIGNAKMGTSYYLESTIGGTYFWKGYSTFVGVFGDGSTDVDSTSSDRELLNKKGVPYPTFKDPKSGKVMSVPSSTTWTKNYYPESWTTAKRTKYLDWYEDNYGDINRSDYEVHHIRPRVYYGSNDYSNLIPLKKSYHQQIVSPWWAAY
ncbi:hypothetical protein [Neobacillus sp. OS1-33]|uniref:HNH endonuclease signature motif containing protein n=1 Tax=Neobacillus sp. OS1-33 TaxID=3070683 RepID=UPI0027DF194D|nr:hypothetical protein [Neobacillus sp. OS1-33]WML26686.1 hypothetical protein RCG22_03315 [Neobacillus sp. OS1-33]